MVSSMFYVGCYDVCFNYNCKTCRNIRLSKEWNKMKKQTKRKLNKSDKRIYVKGYQQAQKDDKLRIDKLQLALNIEREWSKRLRKNCEVLEQKIKGDKKWKTKDI